MSIVTVRLFNNRSNFKDVDLVLRAKPGLHSRLVYYNEPIAIDEMESFLNESVVVQSDLDSKYSFNAGWHELFIHIVDAENLDKFELNTGDVKFEICTSELNLMQDLTEFAIVGDGEIFGSVNGLELHKLKKFDLTIFNDSVLTYDLDFIGKMKDLEELCLSQETLTADIEPLKKCKHIKRLTLIGSFYGDAIIFNHMKDLELLRLGSWKDWIDLSLLNLSKLKELSLQDVKTLHIEDVVCFRKLTSLELYGDLRANVGLHMFSNLTDLEQLIVAATSTYGTLDSIGGLTNLKKLCISGSKVFGRLTDLHMLSKVEKLNLRSTRVRGTLSDISCFYDLTELILNNTMISGDLMPFETLGFMNLEYLDLSKTLVHGDIKCLKRLEYLRYLLLSNTGIAGQIESLSGFKNLKFCKLNDTYVDGNIENLVDLPKMEKLYISNTDISGNASELNSNIPSLERLDYHHSFIKGSWNKAKVVEVGQNYIDKLKQDYESKIADLEKQLAEAKSIR